MINLKLIGMAAAGAMALCAAAYFGGRWEAMKACDARHKVAQLEQNEKVRKTYEKIERSVPYRADDDTAWQWLLQHGSK